VIPMPVHAFSFTGDVNENLHTFTSPVNPVHVSREPLSVNRPISDLFSPTPTTTSIPKEAS